VTGPPPPLLTRHPTGTRLRRARAMPAIRSPPPSTRRAHATDSLCFFFPLCTPRPAPVFPHFLRPGSNAIERFTPLTAHPRRALLSKSECAIALPSLFPNRRSSLELSPPTRMPSPPLRTLARRPFPPSTVVKPAW
jgi:hypothetical protein